MNIVIFVCLEVTCSMMLSIQITGIFLETAKVDFEGGKPSAVNQLLRAATTVFDVFSM